MAKYFSPKRTDETIALTFDFKNVIASSETIVDANWLVEVVDGVDNTPNSTMVIGSEGISGTQVTQLIGSGVDGVVYRMVCKIITDAGPQTIAGIGLLVIDNEKNE